MQPTAPARETFLEASASFLRVRPRIRSRIPRKLILDESRFCGGMERADLGASGFVRVDGARGDEKGSPAGVGILFSHRGETDPRQAAASRADDRRPVRTLWRTGVRVRSALPNATGLNCLETFARYVLSGLSTFTGGWVTIFYCMGDPRIGDPPPIAGWGRDGTGHAFNRVQSPRSKAFGPEDRRRIGAGTGQVVLPGKARRNSPSPTGPLRLN